MSVVAAARRGVRGVLATFFVVAGCNHFWAPDLYRGMMPPGLPWRDTLIVVSGIAEILGGVGLVWPKRWPPRWARRVACWGLVALLVAVFPANVHVALAGVMPGTAFSPEVLWLRLPFQAVFIAAVLWVGRDRMEKSKTRTAVPE